MKLTILNCNTLEQKRYSYEAIVTFILMTTDDNGDLAGFIKDEYIDQTSFEYRMKTNNYRYELSLDLNTGAIECKFIQKQCSNHQCNTEIEEGKDCCIKHSEKISVKQVMDPVYESNLIPEENIAETTKGKINND